MSNSEEQFKRYALKIRCLVHYGKGGKIQCCWRNCQVIDPDCLTLDHVEDDGNLNRQPSGRRRAGSSFYSWILARDFPEGIQVLCCNHQQLKEIRKRRQKQTLPEGSDAYKRGVNKGRIKAQ
jgi:hypothetical protein